jgi:hypothetical protein
MFKNQISQNGFVALYLVILFLGLALTFGLAFSLFNLGQQKIFQNVFLSAQSYYAAEAGVEDALLRLVKKMTLSTPYTFKVGQATSTVEISEIVGGSRTITATGNSLNRLRKIQVGYSVSTQQISFHYGAQVGEGGMTMGNNAVIKGNVYSNGSVVSGKGYIEGTVIVAKNGNRIEGLIIQQDAQAHSCKNSQITGTLTYVSGGTIQNCSAGGAIKIQPNEIPTKDLPIPQTQIDKWKSEAEKGGTISGDYTISGKITQNLGPVKITGNLLVDNNAVLNMTGTIWVVGDLRIDNGATIKLDSNSYGALSGVIVVDGKIKVRPNTYLKGSGQEGSYLLLLSTNPEVSDTTNPAIDVDNNTDAAIFYTNQGLIVVRNKVKARELTGYKIFLNNNAEVAYETGLEEAVFSSGPGGSWKVVSWREVE